MLGPLEVVAEGRAIPLAAKQGRLLGALLVAGGRACSVDELVDAIWNGPPPASSRKLVQVYVSQIRKALPPAVDIVTHGGAYGIVLADGVLDAARFEALVDECRAARDEGNARLASSLADRALGMWRGRAYGDLADEEFARAESERLEELRQVAVEERLAARLALGRHAEVLGEALALAAEHPYRERAHELAMLALYRAGRQADALAHYGAVRGRLDDELGLEPGPTLRDLQRRILRQDPELEAARAFDVDRLPAAPNALIGRERELQELDALLAGHEHRLITLTGAGGSGKTRLALEAARRSTHGFSNGAVFVGLATLRDPALLVHEISNALAVDQQGGDALETLAAALGSRELLVVLDNLEHLREAAPAIVELVARAPRLTVLCTSRVVLHLTGERVYPVSPLGAEDATALFVTRAREGDPTFTVAGEATTIGAISERLDRLPLAIELAATRARVLTPTQLLARLDRRLPVLAVAPRDLPARQRTLRSTIEWSFDLLEPHEQELLESLSIFVGGFTLEAMEAVCRSGVDELAALVDASLVQRARDRYTMLETIREFAAEMLEKSGRASATARLHATYFESFGRGLELYPEAIEVRQAERYDLALAEKANLRAALEWSQENDARLGLELAVSLEQHWVSHDPLGGRRHLELLLGRAAERPPHRRARARRCLGGTTDVLGDVQQALSLYEESLALFAALDDEWEIVHLRHRLANCTLQLGHVPNARALYEENLVRARAGGFRFLEAEALGGLGWVAGTEGDLETAWQLTSEHVHVTRGVGWRWGETLGRIYLAELSLALGRFDAAEAEARTALVLARGLDDRQNTVRALALLAARAGAAGEPQRAGRLWGSIESEEARGPVGRGEGHRKHRSLAVGDGGVEFEQALVEGRAMTLEEAASYGLAG